MAASVREVAREFRTRLPGVGELKLHKLLYYAQGHHLATFGVPLFGETISAWDMGPVVGTLWYEDRHDIPQPDPVPLEEAELNTVGYVLSRYGGLTGDDLKNLTHTEPPWQEADRLRGPGRSVRIPIESMREHFRARAREDDDAAPLLDSEAVEALLEGAQRRLGEPSREDSVEALLGRLARLAG